VPPIFSGFFNVEALLRYNSHPIQTVRVDDF
jgi:hypothetical protein